MVSELDLRSTGRAGLNPGRRAAECNPGQVVYTGALKMQDRKMTDKDIAGGGKCRTGI